MIAEHDPDQGYCVQESSPCFKIGAALANKKRSYIIMGDFLMYIMTPDPSLSVVPFRLVFRFRIDNESTRQAP